MDIFALYQLLNTSSALKLLRSDNAALTISFLHKTFSLREQLSVPFSAMREALDAFLGELPDDIRARYPAEPERYLTEWCGDQHRYLRRYYESGDEPLVEPTPDTERVLRWIGELGKPDQFVGTESRFLRIFDLLNEIVRLTTVDPEKRLADLRAERLKIDREIEELERTQTVAEFSSTQVRERFMLANSEARRLVSEFREVEENFKEITRSIQETYLSGTTSKGAIVGYVLDADSALRESDQGRSFYAFWNFLLSPSRQEELRDLVEQVYSLPDVASSDTSDTFLRRIKFHLLDAGDKVLRSNHRLAGQIRRTLVEHYIEENRRVADLLAEIKRLALKAREVPPTVKDFLLIEGLPEIELMMERPWWSPAIEVDFSAPVDVEDAGGEVSFSALFQQFVIDKARLRAQIDETLKAHAQVTLRELVERYPIERGLSELLGYLAIASGHERHVVNPDARSTVYMKPWKMPGGSMVYQARSVCVPEIVFVR